MYMNLRRPTNTKLKIGQSADEGESESSISGIKGEKIICFSHDIERETAGPLSRKLEGDEVITLVSFRKIVYRGHQIIKCVFLCLGRGCRERGRVGLFQARIKIDLYCCPFFFSRLDHRYRERLGRWCLWQSLKYETELEKARHAVWVLIRKLTRFENLEIPDRVMAGAMWHLGVCGNRVLANYTFELLRLPVWGFENSQREDEIRGTKQLWERERVDDRGRTEREREEKKINARDET